MNTITMKKMQMRMIAFIRMRESEGQALVDSGVLHLCSVRPVELRQALDQQIQSSDFIKCLQEHHQM